MNVAPQVPTAATHGDDIPRSGQITAAATAFAALFAAVPLMLGFGEGAELRRPLGLSIFGGLLVSQVLTLYTTPVIYLAFDRLGRRLSRREPASGLAGERA